MSALLRVQKTSEDEAQESPNSVLSMQTSGSTGPTKQSERSLWTLSVFDFQGPPMPSIDRRATASKPSRESSIRPRRRRAQRIIPPPRRDSFSEQGDDPLSPQSSVDACSPQRTGAGSSSLSTPAPSTAAPPATKPRRGRGWLGASSHGNRDYVGRSAERQDRRRTREAAQSTTAATRAARGDDVGSETGPGTARAGRVANGRPRAVAAPRRTCGTGRGAWIVRAGGSRHRRGVVRGYSEGPIAAAPRRRRPRNIHVAAE